MAKGVYITFISKESQRQDQMRKYSFYYIISRSGVQEISGDTYKELKDSGVEVYPNWILKNGINDELSRTIQDSLEKAIRLN